MYVCKRFELNLKPLDCCMALRKFLLTIIFIPVSPWGSTRSSCQTSNELIAAERSIFLWGIFIYSVQCSLHINTPHRQTHCTLSVLSKSSFHKSNIRYRPLIVRLQVSVLVLILPLLKRCLIHCFILSVYKPH